MWKPFLILLTLITSLSFAPIAIAEDGEPLAPLSTDQKSEKEAEQPDAPVIENEELKTKKPESKRTQENAEQADVYPAGTLPEPEISNDLGELPFPTRRMRELILEATKSGDIEKLRPFIGIGENMTQLSLGGVDGDPIEFLKSLSGDEDGHEILAILEEVLEAGYAKFDAGTEREMYVWPYFFALPINDLTDRQRVELFRIATFGDFQDMKDFGGYIFYRVGISPTGRWQFFVAGD